MIGDLNTITQTTTSENSVFECGLCGKTVPVTVNLTWTHVEDHTTAVVRRTPAVSHQCPGGQP